MTTVHEMGHFTQFIFYAYNKPLYDRSVAAFNACTKSLYNSYDLQDAQEFFAGPKQIPPAGYGITTKTASTSTTCLLF